MPSRCLLPCGIGKNNPQTMCPFMSCVSRTRSHPHSATHGRLYTLWHGFCSGCPRHVVLQGNYVVLTSLHAAVHPPQVVWPLFGSLPDAVSSGANVWQQRFGQPGAQIFARIYSTPHDVLRFMRGMHSFAQVRPGLGCSPQQPV